MTHAIVFATTLTPSDTSLGELAVRWAHRAGAALRLVHVCEDVRAPAVLGTDEETLLGDVRARLDAEAHRLRGLTGAVVRPHLAAGAPVPALVAISSYEQAALVLVGDARQRSRLLGSTAERTSREAPAPVLMLRSAGRLQAWLDGRRPLRVLVGLDGGLAAEAARVWAERLARLGPCTVELVHVCVPEEVHARLHLPPPRDEHTLSAEAHAAVLGQLERGHPTPSGSGLSIVAGRGSADAHLASLADRNDVDLVVVGQRQSSLFERLWSGSVGQGLLRSSPVSVATVPPGAPSSPLVRVPRVVLVGADFSPASVHALAQAAMLASGAEALHVAHVLPALPNPAEVAQLKAEAWRRLQAASPVGFDRPVVHHLLEGDPAGQLLALAARCSAELLVLGTSQRPLGTLLGSVARAVSDRAAIPVLLVPAPRP